MKANYSLYLTTALISGLMVAHPQASFAVGALEVPANPTVVGGAATFASPAAGQLNITQKTDRTVINWGSFNIGAKATTTFIQPQSTSLAVNRVQNAKVDPTQILGTLQANGRVMVLDKNGVIFKPGSTINVGGIIASTGDVDTATVMSGAALIPLTNVAPGTTVQNDTTINVADSGLVALVAPNVVNKGTINAKLGFVTLGAGDTATVDLFGDGLVALAMTSNLSHALIRNTGTINASGGTVRMSTAVATNILDDTINTSGIVNVSSATQKGGDIVLSGNAKVTVSGTLDADGSKGGGTVTILGSRIAVSGQATARGNGSNGGTITVNSYGTVDFSGTLNANGDSLGGIIGVAGNKIDLSGSAFAEGRASSGKGGLIVFLANQSSEIAKNGFADVSGGAGGGRILLEGNTARIAGTANAFSAKSGQGGNIELDANNIVLSGLLNAHGVDGGGNISAIAQNAVKVTKSSQLLADSVTKGAGGIITLSGIALGNQMDGLLNANGADSGGRINVLSDHGYVDFEGRALARSISKGAGGVINITAATDINDSGTMSASGVDHGGWINITAGGDAGLYGKTCACSTTHGDGGTINVAAGQNAKIKGEIAADGVGGGGTINLKAGNSLNVSSYLHAISTGHGTGGTANLSAPTVKFSGDINVDGVNGGGSATLAGGAVSSTGDIHADATNIGDGGTISFLGAAINKIFSGTLSAEGGPAGGNGGTITVAAPDTINAGVVADVSAPAGNPGTFTH